MTERTLITNARLFDSAPGTLNDGATIVIEDGRFAHVTHEPIDVADAARTIDARGRVVLPGLIDAHAHVVAVSHDLIALALQPPSLITAQAKDMLAGMLDRGFTTVRDAGGADFGLQEAVERGFFEGPRLFIAGFPISQTGGHADMRPKGVRSHAMFCSCAGLGLIGAIADGVGEVRRAVREQCATAPTRSRSGPAAASPAPPTRSTARSSRSKSCARPVRRLRLRTSMRWRMPIRQGRPRLPRQAHGC